MKKKKYGNRYQERRSEYISILGGKCVRCSTTEDLEFDHIVPSTKSFNIGHAWGRKDQQEVMLELAKCQLLCYTCHLAKTKEDFGVGAIEVTPYSHGNYYSSYKKQCQCSVCLTYKTMYAESRRQKRRVANPDGTRFNRIVYKSEVEHGTRPSYTRGCRCPECKTANAVAEKQRRYAKKMAQ